MHINVAADMSSDTHVPSIRLRNPPDLSSSSQRIWPRRALQRQQLVSVLSSSTNPSTAGLSFDPDSYDTQQDGPADPNDMAHWLDLERFEDWDKPTLETLRPDIHIPLEEELFPIAVAEDGETLPFEFHPSHPYGDLHQPMYGFSSKLKVPNGRHQHTTATEPIKQEDNHSMQSVLHRARHSTGANPPHWPFRRYGPGPSGSNCLVRAELSRPWRPYRNVWTDLNLENLIPEGKPSHDAVEISKPMISGATGSRSQQSDRTGYTSIARPQGPRSLLDEIDSLFEHETSQYSTSPRASTSPAPWASSVQTS